MSAPASNEFLVEHPCFRGAKEELRRCIESYGTTPDPRCVAILGDSGCGKTTAIDDFVDEYHKEYRLRCDAEYKRPILVVETPSRVTVKSLASEVLNTIGDPYYSNGTEVQMTHRILGLLENLETHLLIFDEMQNLIDQDSDTLNYKASDWLKGLINKSRIPTVVVGLQRTEELFLVNEQLRRRFRAPYRMESFAWEEADSRKNLKGFLKTIQAKLPASPSVRFDSDDISYRFCCASGGVVGYIMAIVREAELLTRGAAEGGIDVNVLATAYENVICRGNDVTLNPFLAPEHDVSKALRAVVPAQPALLSKRKRV